MNAYKVHASFLVTQSLLHLSCKIVTLDINQYLDKFSPSGPYVSLHPSSHHVIDSFCWLIECTIIYSLDLTWAKLKLSCYILPTCSYLSFDAKCLPIILYDTKFCSSDHLI